MKSLIALSVEKADKTLKELFTKHLPIIGAATDRNIYKCAWEIAWPQPPRPVVEGMFLHWKHYVSVVTWTDELIALLVEAGGTRKAIEAIVSCRIQEQVERLALELQEARREIETALRTDEEPAAETPESSS